MAEPENSAGFRLARRHLLGAAGVAAVMGSALAEEKPGPPSHPKGPKVFLDYDQVELDAAYDQDAYAANRPQLLSRYASASELVRARLGPPQRVAYGPRDVEELDIYRAAGAKAPIMVFIHGGAWRTGLAKNYAFPAELFVAAGAHFVVPDFAAAGEVSGDLTVMAQQVRRAIAWVQRNAASFGGDGERLHLCGHSSGAHLAGVALITDWQKDFSVPDDLVKTALLVSGMYDLKGPRLSARSSYVAFDDASEAALSTERHLDKLRTPLAVAYASLDTPEFQRQSLDFATAVKRAGKPVELISGDHYNHFELIETLANPYGLLGRAALAQMGLAKG
jgi:arylformamidase